MTAEENRQSELYLKNRRELEMGGVGEVLQYTQDLVQVQTVLGCLTIRGDELKILSFSVETGQFSLRGRITALLYTDEAAQREKWIRRLLR